jgi:cytochrome c-type biogenesis protein CcmH/NrfG
MFRVLILSLLFVSLSLRADGVTNPPPVLAGIAEFKAAFQAWDGERFARAAELFTQATVQEPNNVTNFYWLGVTEFHHMLQLRSVPGNTVPAEVAQATALEALNTAVKLDAHNAECHALLATIYGIRIGDRWIRALRLGPSAMSHSNKAMKDGATNPRVRYLLATGDYYMASGTSDLRKALKNLLLAETYFASEATNAPGPLEPRWGRSSCHTFIGLTYEKLGNFTNAAAYFRKSLAAHPADNLARTSLNRVIPTNSVAEHP